MLAMKDRPPLLLSVSSLESVRHICKDLVGTAHATRFEMLASMCRAAAAMLRLSRDSCGVLQLC